MNLRMSSLDSKKMNPAHLGMPCTYWPFRNIIEIVQCSFPFLVFDLGMFGVFRYIIARQQTIKVIDQ